MFDVIKPKKIKIDEKYGKNCGKFEVNMEPLKNLMEKWTKLEKIGGN